MRRSQYLPLPPEYITPPPIFYHSFETLHDLPLPPRIYPLLNIYLRPGQNQPLPPRIYPLLNIYIRRSQNVPISPIIYPLLNMYATLPESTPPSQNIPPPPLRHLYATLPEYTRPSQNIPPFSKNCEVCTVMYYSRYHAVVEKGDIYSGREVDRLQIKLGSTWNGH